MLERVRSICDDERVTTTSYSRVLQPSARAPGQLTFTIPADWMQGRSAFGGLQVALILRAMRALAPADAPLRTVQATFVAPLPAGEVVARASVLRSGKSATHVEGHVGDRAATAIAVFGTPRASVVRIEPRRSAVAPTVDFVLPFIPGVTPEFTQHFRSRWRNGAPPFTGSPTPVHAIEIAIVDEDAEGGRATEAHLVAIADLIPPIGLSYLQAPAPGSTLTWMLELVRDRFDDLPLAGWMIDAELIAARDGYTSQRVMVWAPDGSLAAISTQSMSIFG